MIYYIKTIAQWSGHEPEEKNWPQIVPDGSSSEDAVAVFRAALAEGSAQIIKVISSTEI